MAFPLSKHLFRSFITNLNRNIKIKTSANSRIMILSLNNSELFWSYNFLRYSSGSTRKRVTIIFEKPDGTRLPREGKVGDRIQDIIGQFNPDFDGFGACGGTLSCSTCHLILSKEDYERLGEPGPDEEDTLFRVMDIQPTSRLACAMEIGPEMDGMVVKLPAEVKDMREA